MVVENYQALHDQARVKLELALQEGEGFVSKPSITDFEFIGFGDSNKVMFQVTIADKSEGSTTGLIYVWEEDNKLVARF